MIDIEPKYWVYPYRVTQNEQYYTIEKHLNLWLFKIWFPIRFIAKNIHVT